MGLNQNQIELNDDPNILDIPPPGQINTMVKSDGSIWAKYPDGSVSELKSINSDVSVKVSQENFGQLTSELVVNQTLMDTIVFDEQGFFDGSIKDSGTANGVQSNNTLKDDTKNWVDDEWEGYIVAITSGSGDREVKLIQSNDSDTLTLADDWIVNPTDGVSTYEISLKNRLTVPQGLGGKYILSAKCAFDHNPNGVRSIVINQNPLGGFPVEAFGQQAIQDVGYESVAMIPSAIIELNEGDFVIMGTFQNSGGPLNYHQVRPNETVFSMARIGN